jgi:hypothetical protein
MGLFIWYSTETARPCISHIPRNAGSLLCPDLVSQRFFRGGVGQVDKLTAVKFSLVDSLSFEVFGRQHSANGEAGAVLPAANGEAGAVLQSSGGEGRYVDFSVTLSSFAH